MHRDAQGQVEHDGEIDRDWRVENENEIQNEHDPDMGLSEIVNWEDETSLDQP